MKTLDWSSKKLCWLIFIFQQASKEEEMQRAPEIYIGTHSSQLLNTKPVCGMKFQEVGQRTTGELKAEVFSDFTET
jgi:hypothetical protein